MARLASESKAGYYATPPEEMELLLRALHVPEVAAAEKPIYIYDPCCGEGEALSMLTQAFHEKGAVNTRSYGSEIEDGRYEVAAEVLDHVLHEGYQFVRTEPKFSLLWLNPPYQDGFSERTELTFLRALTGSKQGVLQKGGILLFCIPQYVVKDTAGVLSGRFLDLKVFRFTDANYDVFKQVVVVGRLGKAPAADQKKAYKTLVAIGEGERDMLPTLEDMEPFDIPPCDTDGEPLFRAGPLHPEEMAKDFESSAVLGDIRSRLAQLSSAATMKRPMLPLKPGHLGISIASGAVGGNMGNHIIAGVTKKRTDDEAMHDDDGNYVGTRRIHHFASIIRVFTPDGVIDLK
ncbi:MULTISPECIES: DUF6094 domain-containing protein [unclassified Paenibacillus]|uniref:DUF6094 domain-containing protein n=1 Tax=unclassified Paenibacillus TaxID=185978 RepID=UPI002782F9EE|nr:MULTISPECIES: DUF6094 domain-containing protein [unclassified Paenibacillus]MDQ0896415.1 hypothetical protein [Paenibacillus sp. V4I7]MDQ0914041.1 hypothetical protein [Paenibacillus sp. V4I5]